MANMKAYYFEYEILPGEIIQSIAAAPNESEARVKIRFYFGDGEIRAIFEVGPECLSII